MKGSALTPARGNWPDADFPFASQMQRVNEDVADALIKLGLGQVACVSAGIVLTAN